MWLPGLDSNLRPSGQQPAEKHRDPLFSLLMVGIHAEAVRIYLPRNGDVPAVPHVGLDAPARNVLDSDWLLVNRC